MTNINDMETIEKICELLAANRSVEYISTETECDITLIENIERGLEYKDIALKYNLTTANSPRRAVSDDVIHIICQRLEDGETVDGVSSSMGISDIIVSKIRSHIYASSISTKYDFKNDDKSYTNSKNDIINMLKFGNSPLDVAIVLNLSPRDKALRYVNRLNSQINR